MPNQSRGVQGLPFGLSRNQHQSALALGHTQRREYIGESAGRCEGDRVRVGWNYQEGAQRGNEKGRPVGSLDDLPEGVGRHLPEVLAYRHKCCLVRSGWVLQ